MQRSTRTHGCCGMIEIWDLDADGYGEWVPGGNGGMYYVWKPGRSQADTIPFLLKDHMAGIAFATTSNEGNDAESIRHLRAHEFYPVLTTPNPKTGNQITLWVRDLSEGKKPVRLTKRPWQWIWKKGLYYWALVARGEWNPQGRVRGDHGYRAEEV